MPMTADLSDESLLFQTVRDVTVVLFSRLLSTDFLQHNCSTQGEKDLSFGRRFLCFTFAFMIRAFELNGAENTCIRNFESNDTAQSVPFSW